MTDAPTDQTTTDDAVPENGHYILITRQHSASLAVLYPTQDEAEAALDESIFIDGLCEEDCLEAEYGTEVPTAENGEIPWEIIIPPNEEEDGDEDEDEEPAVERTVVFFTDPRTPTLFLVESTLSLISALSIQRGIVDLSNLAGFAIADAFVRAGLPYDRLDFGQEDSYLIPGDDPDPDSVPAIERDRERFRSLASGVHTVDVGSLGAIDANLVIAPAMVGPDEALVDFSVGTVVGTVVTQAETLRRPMLIIDTPERGLRMMPSGRYERTLLHVEGKDGSEGSDG